MATKKPLADALQSLIGKYILEEDFNAANISVSLWKGDVTLSGVRLNVKAINRDFGWEENPDIINVNNEGNSQPNLPPLKESSFYVKKGNPTKKSFSDANITTTRKPVSSNSVEHSTENMNSRNETGAQYSSAMSYTAPRSYINENWAINVNCTNYREGVSQRSFLESLFASIGTFSSTKYRMPKNVTLHNGYIDRIELEIPWSALATKHAAIRITGVKLTFGPTSKRKTKMESQNISNVFHKHYAGDAKGKRSSLNARECPRHSSMSTAGASMTSSIASSLNKASTSGQNANVSETTEAKGSSSRQTTFGQMILRSIPYSSQIQREFHKNRRAREEEFLLKRRREVMQELDQTRRNLKHLKKQLFPIRSPYESSSDDGSKHDVKNSPTKES